MTNRYKITIEYDGTAYCGFQRQKSLELKSIAGVLEAAILKMSQEVVKVAACGRTDAGVHALGQVVHFDLNKKFETRKIISGLNHYLKTEDVAILDCEIMDENFHARISAKMRSYCYIIVNREPRLVLEKNRAHHVVKPLDENLMQEAANFLIGKHDFTSFRDSECQAKSPIRSIESIKITRKNEKIFINIKARSFLHHMVRNITGTLIWFGKKKFTPDKMKKILENKDRTKSGPNAPSCGLYFVKCEYPNL